MTRTRFGSLLVLAVLLVGCGGDGKARVHGKVTLDGAPMAEGQVVFEKEGSNSAVIPVKNGAGQYVADDRTLDELEGDGRVVFRYVGANPNGSRRDIAGIRNEAGNVVGLMPHPEHAIDALTGPGTDGLGMFVSVLKALVTQ